MPSRSDRDEPAVTPQTDKHSPQNIEAEIAVLGAIMLGERGSFERAAELIERGDFYREAHGLIYGAMQTLNEKDEPGDIVTLKDELGRRGALDNVGGIAYLMQLGDFVPTTANLAYHAGIVREKSRRRKLVALGARVVDRANNETISISDTIDLTLADLSDADDRRGKDGTPPLAFLQVGAFLASVGEPPAMLVEGLIPANALVLLTGKPKMGKSLMALDLAEAVARGVPVWGTRAVTKPGAVVYIGMEDGAYEIANRLLARGLSKATADVPLYVCAERVTLGDPRSVSALEKLIAPLAPSFLIIDTAREALGVKDYNDAAELSERLRPLRELARKLCSVLLVSHNRKAAGDSAVDEIAGSNAFTSSVDGWISARSKIDDGDTRRLNLDIDGRGGMRGSVTVECELRGGFRFTEVGTETLTQERQDEASEAAAKRERERLEPMIAFLRGAGGTTVAEIATGTKSSIDTAARLVKAGVAAGVLMDTGTKRTTEKRPATVYALCPGYAGNNQQIRKPSKETADYADYSGQNVPGFGEEKTDFAEEYLSDLEDPFPDEHPAATEVSQTSGAFLPVPADHTEPGYRRAPARRAVVYKETVGRHHGRIEEFIQHNGATQFEITVDGLRLDSSDTFEKASNRWKRYLADALELERAFRPPDSDLSDLGRDESDDESSCHYYADTGVLTQTRPRRSTGKQVKDTLSPKARSKP